MEEKLPDDSGIFNLDGAVLGSASPRKSALLRVSDSLGPVSPISPNSPSSPKCSLDAVMSEYDSLMERYGNQALTPEFLTSSDSLAAGQLKLVPDMEERAPIASADSTSSSSDFTPVPPPRRSKVNLPSSPSSPLMTKTIVGPILEAEADSEDGQIERRAEEEEDEEVADKETDLTEDAIHELAIELTSSDNEAVTNSDHTPSEFDKVEEGYVARMNNLSVELRQEPERNIPGLSDEDVLEEEAGMMMSEEEGGSHALPGETIIISDIIEL